MRDELRAATDKPLVRSTNPAELAGVFFVGGGVLRKGRTSALTQFFANTSIGVSEGEKKGDPLSESPFPAQSKYRFSKPVLPRFRRRFYRRPGLTTALQARRTRCQQV